MKIFNSRQDAIICLAAGNSQIPILKVAKSLGYIVAAVDKNPSAPGLKYADIHICLSTYNVKAIIKELDLLKKKYKFIGILNRSAGPPVKVSAELSEYFGIQGVPINVAKSLVNKDQLRRICTKYNFPVPNYKIYSVENANSINISQFPVIIKPGLSLIGKSGITVVSSKKHLDKAIEYAAKNTINNKIILEEYLPGPDLTLVSFVQDGKLSPVCFLDELNNELKDGKIEGRGYKIHSPPDKNELELAAHKIAKKMIDSLKINRSPFMVSFRIASDGGLRIIEVHLDLGGDLLIEQLFPNALTYDFKEIAVRMSVGDKVNFDNTSITPTAIFYEKGKGLISERSVQVLTAESHQILNKKIMEAGL